MMLSSREIEAIKAHAVAEYPREACGLIIGAKYRPAANVAQNPEEDFRIPPAAIAAAAQVGKIEAVVHSHPGGKDYPSFEDMQAQLAMGIPWGIVSLASPESAREPFWFGDDLPVPPLIGREFRHGVTDCFALVRDWFRVELGVTIPNYPRQHEWWKADKNMFIDLFRDAGFRRIPRVERKGDCVIGMVLGRVPNHSGVYLGGGLILHHLERRLSRQEPIGPWMKYVTHCLRHEG